MASLKTSRIDFRLPSELKDLFERAAASLGVSLSDFAIATLRERALEVNEQRERTTLSERDRGVFLGILDSSEPNEALLRSASRYKRLKEAGGPDVDDRTAGEST